MLLRKPHVYIKVTSGQATAIHVEEERSATASSKGLSHSRTLMGDFFEVEKCFKHLIAELFPNKMFKPSPNIIVHLLEDLEGGHTNVEYRAFREAAFGAGASNVYLAAGTKPLSNQEVLAMKFEMASSA